jgi:hypothetical protein
MQLSKKSRGGLDDITDIVDSMIEYFDAWGVWWFINPIRGAYAATVPRDGKLAALGFRPNIGYKPRPLANANFEE